MSEWTFVTKMKSKKKGSLHPVQPPAQINGIPRAIVYSTEELSLAEVKINKLLDVLPLSEFFLRTCGALSTSFAAADSTVHQIYILGVGDIIASPVAMLQFAFILCLRTYGLKNLSWGCPQPLLSDDASLNSKCDTVIFEPLFSDSHRHLCTQYNVLPTSENCCGRYNAHNCVHNTDVTGSGTVGTALGTALGTTLSSTVLTLFYMPHCPHGLYSNVMWHNWNYLEHIMIIGNRLVSSVD